MSITSANAVLMLTVAGLFPTPLKLQQFSADDLFEFEEIENAELSMGIDGVLAAGFKFVPLPQKITFMADSPSNVIFDNWNQYEIVNREKFRGGLQLQLSGLGTQWICSNGVLSRFKPVPDAKKTLQPRSFTITWQSVTPAPL